jgi:hypothetical protein
MSALGQKQTSDWRLLMSALPPKADIVRRGGNVRFVPEADIANSGSLSLALGGNESANLTRVGKDHVRTVTHHASTDQRWCVLFRTVAACICL